MKPKQDNDRQSIADLLKKLQSSYLGGGQKAEKKAKLETDRSDADFQEKLASMLGKVTAPSEKVSKAKPKADKKAAEPKPHAPATPPSAEEPAVEKISMESPPSAKIIPDVASPKTKKKAASPKKKKQSIPLDKPSEERPAPPEEPILPPQVKPEVVVEDLVAKEPEVIVEEPEATADEPAVIVEEPEVAADEPAVIVEEPEAAADEPEVTVEDPDAAADEPEVIAEEPEASADEPEVVVEEPEKAKQAEKEPAPIRIPSPAPKLPSIRPGPPPASPTERVHVIKPAPQPKAQAKSKPAAPRDAIVIRPPADRIAASADAIVIRPRAEKPQRPTPRVVQASVSAPPIKIGKEVPSGTWEIPSPDPEITVKPNMNHEEITAANPSVAPSDAASPSGEAEKTAQASKTAANIKRTVVRERVSLPQSAQPASAQKTPARRHTVQSPSPVEDDVLEEVLESADESELMIEELPFEEPEEVVVPTKKPSLFQRRRQEREQLAEQSLPVMEVIQKRSGLSEEDIALILELGYENELGKLVGYETLKRLKNEQARKIAQHEIANSRTAFGYRGEELVGTRHKDAVVAAYLQDRKRLLLRTVLTALLSIALLLLDVPTLWQVYSAPFIEAYPLLFPLVSLLLLAATALLHFSRIRAGLRSIFRFAVTPYAICAVLPPVVLLYDLAKLFAASPMLPINFLTSLVFLATTVCDLLRLSCEMRVLQILQTETPKYVLSEPTPQKRKLRRGDKIVKIINDDRGEPTYQVSECYRVTGFFRRSNALHTARTPLIILLGASFVLTVALGFATAIRTSSLSSALSAAAATLLATAPLSALFTFFYPLTRANRLLSQQKCALVGEESVEEYRVEKTVIFADIDLFTAQKRAELSVREGSELRTDLLLTGALLRKLGGTVGALGNSSANHRTPPSVSIVRIQHGGVEAIVDGTRHLLIGDVAFLAKSGIRVPAESTDDSLRRTESTALMYVAVDGVLKLRYEVEYRANPQFEAMIRDLADRNTAVAIHTYDPNLNNAFLCNCRADTAEPVEVIKPGRFEEEKPLEIADSGAVALGAATDLIYPLHAAHHIALARRFGFRIQLIASLVGAGAILLLALLGKLSLLGVLPLAGYQIFWMLVSLFAANSEINRQTLCLPIKKERA